MVLFRNKKALHSNGKPGVQVHRNKGEELSFMNLEGAAVNEVCCRKWKFRSIVNSHWLSYGGLPLAELLLRKRESFLPPT